MANYIRALKIDRFHCQLMPHRTRTLDGTSRSFKVKHFRVTGKPIRHFMMLHYDTGFSSRRSEDTAKLQKKIAGSDHPTVV